MKSPLRTLDSAATTAPALANGSPAKFLGRPMKVAKEEIVGLVTALGMFVEEDEAAEMGHYPALAQRESMRWSRRPAC